jgi:hypothetical protein
MRNLVKIGETEWRRIKNKRTNKDTFFFTYNETPLTINVNLDSPIRIKAWAER